MLSALRVILRARQRRTTQCEGGSLLEIGLKSDEWHEIDANENYVIALTCIEARITQLALRLKWISDRVFILSHNPIENVL